MTAIDIQSILFSVDLIKDHITECKKNHRKVNCEFISKTAKNLAEYAEQCSRCQFMNRINGMMI